MTTFEDGLGTGPKSGQKLRRRRSEPGPVVPRQCLTCEHRCGCDKKPPKGARFLECYRVQEGAR
jgi:hypothetical protein